MKCDICKQTFDLSDMVTSYICRRCDNNGTTKCSFCKKPNLIEEMNHLSYSSKSFQCVKCTITTWNRP